MGVLAGAFWLGECCCGRRHQHGRRRSHAHLRTRNDASLRQLVRPCSEDAARHAPPPSNSPTRDAACHDPPWAAALCGLPGFPLASIKKLGDRHGEETARARAILVRLLAHRLCVYHLCTRNRNILTSYNPLHAPGASAVTRLDTESEIRR